MAHATATKSPVTYHRLTPGARAQIQWSGFTVADYIRAFDPDGQWHGDRCGCPDDRCRDGYHHDRHEDCGCLAAHLRSGVEKGYLGWTRSCVCPAGASDPLCPLCGSDQ